MCLESDLKEKAERHKRIKKAAEKVSKSNAKRKTELRRRIEEMADLKSIGITEGDLND